jgi:hypothetical protein
MWSLQIVTPLSPRVYAEFRLSSDVVVRVVRESSRLFDAGHQDVEGDSLSVGGLNSAELAEFRGIKGV